MTERYVPVGWNVTKIVYDAIALGIVGVYISVFLWIAPSFQHVTLPLDDYTMRMNAFGTCAFLLLSMILSIGPAARLDPRFLPLLYNRRHLGVLATAVAATHAYAALDWYFSYGPYNRFEMLLRGNTSFFQVHGFPFEVFGMFALLVMLLLAATSHDFWLRFLTPPAWKGLHMALYAAYLAVVAHISLGALQASANPLLAVVTGLCVVGVASLHVAASRRRTVEAPIVDGWIDAGPASAIVEDHGIVVTPPGAESIAIFRHGGRLSAVTNLCAHQNGPLGEGRVFDGCITCPWHGYQYRLEDGRAPPPFTETLATFRLRVVDGHIMVDPIANPPGTFVEPATVP
ncbi:MAG: Rieske 2Fe-2S domain-containing protein [Acetobacteraceae bacterium]|jgi:nitrite reductase/ring-hydroxylating ferredoxin subunit